MTLPASGTITSTQVIAELGLDPGSSITIPPDVRALVSKPTGPIVWPTNFHGTNAITNPGGFSGNNLASIDIVGEAGDLVVLYDMALSDTATPPATVVSAGYTAIINTTATNENGLGVRHIVAYRVLTGTGSTYNGMDGAERNRKVWVSLRTALPIATVTPVGWVSRLTGDNPTDIVLNSDTGSPNMVVVAFAASQNEVGLTFSPVPTDANALSATRAAYRRYTRLDVPADHTIGMGDGGDTNGLAAGWFEFTH